MFGIGKVYLIGIGPGDSNLVTLRARKLIEMADVIIYDHIADPQVLEWTQSKAKIIFVGKTADRNAFPQDEIQELLVTHAKMGHQVIRLKNGDPSVFECGEYDTKELEIDKIPYEIVPGVTAALAAASYLGISLSKHENNSAITLLDTRNDVESVDLSIDFKQYAIYKGTLCFYSYIDQLPKIIKDLKEGGMSGDTPIAIIESATLNNQYSHYSTLGSIVSDIDSSRLDTPAIFIIGEVVSKQTKNNWFESRPLYGKRIVVTRAREQAGDLSNLLRDQGADIIELPFISVESKFDPQRVSEVFAGIAVYEWIIFTSANGVQHFFELFYKAFNDIRCLGPMRIAAVGAATAREIEKHKLMVDLVPAKANSDTLAKELIDNEGVEGVQILVVTGNQNRDNLVKHLESDDVRAIVDTLSVYSTNKTDLTLDPSADRYRKLGADAILFTSSSAVKSFIDQQVNLTLTQEAKQPDFGSIGPLTTKTLKSLKLPVAFESPKAILDDFVVETITHLKRKL